MAFVQDLKAVEVIPSLHLKNSGLFRKNPWLWPKGYAFGGWIYNASVDLGFSKSPTQITLSIVMEEEKPVVQPPDHKLKQVQVPQFDINDTILGMSLTSTDPRTGRMASNFFDEQTLGNFYTIYIHGLVFNRMYLFDYNISVESNQKVLNATFKDYSVILDKIYIGLTKKQGPQRTAWENWVSAGMGKNSHARVELEAFCPNCYLEGEGFSNPAPGGWFGAGLFGRGVRGGGRGARPGFFNVEKGHIKRDCGLGSFIGRGSPWFAAAPRYFTNIVGADFDPTNPTNVRDFQCYGGNAAACSDRGYLGNVHPRVVRRQRWVPVVRYNPRDYWNRLRGVVAGGWVEPVGFTMDGGYLMIGTEEFQEKPCGEAPSVNYSFTELLDSLTVRGLNFSAITWPDGTPRHPDKNKRYRANYIGTLREVLEQWCGVFALDYYYRDNMNPLFPAVPGNNFQGFYFMDLQQGAEVAPIRNVVDPNSVLGVEFGGTAMGTSAIISYKESSTLENTFVQKSITANIKPFMVKERKKTITRYVPILPLHPLDFSLPNFSSVPYTSLLGEDFSYYKLANAFPWENPRFLPTKDQGAAATHDSRRRLWHRTNRQLWDVDISIALSRYSRELRDIYVGSRMIEYSLSHIVPTDVYPVGHKKEGEAKQYLADGAGKPTRLATDAELEANPRPNIVAKRINFPAHPTDYEKKEFDAQCEALGFQQISEVEDIMVKQNVIEILLNKQEIEDVSLDAQDYKIFVGYYDKVLHDEYVAWEQRCAEGMYKFGAIIGGTLPAYPFLPRDYFGVTDGGAGLNPGDKGLSIPKLNNSFEPDANQFPILNLEHGQRPTYSTEAFSAPYNGVLINSGNYMPTGLYFASLENPWGYTKDNFDKEWAKTFGDNACSAFNNSLNVIEAGGFAPIETQPWPEKKQSWDIGMFAPKFFDDTEQILDACEELLEQLYTDNRLVDEVSVNKWDIDYSFRNACKKVTLMVLTNVKTHPNIYFDARYLGHGAVNPEARKQRELWEIAERKRRQVSDIRNKCDRDILYEFCEEAIKERGVDDPASFVRPGWGSMNVNSCAVDPTGQYKEGFARELIGGYVTHGGFKHPGMENSRVCRLTVIRNPTTEGYVPTSDLGHYHLMDLEEDLETLPRKIFAKDIIYPMNNFRLVNDVGIRLPSSSSIYQTYSGIWNANVTIEDRMPERMEIYGEPPAGMNATAGVKVINNTIDPDMDALLDPDGRGFITKMYDQDGDAIQTIEQYHNVIAYGDTRGRPNPAGGLDNYSVVTPNNKIDLKLAGSLLNFPLFSRYCEPRNGLTSVNVSLSDGGVQTSLTFSDRPPQAPQQESILNKIGPRMI
jgi:hypothetical protein